MTAIETLRQQAADSERLVLVEVKEETALSAVRFVGARGIERRGCDF